MNEMDTIRRLELKNQQLRAENEKLRDVVWEVKRIIRDEVGDVVERIRRRISEVS